MIGKSSAAIAVEYMKKRIKELDEIIYGDDGYMNQNPPDFSAEYVRDQTELDTLRTILGKIESES